MASQCGPDSTKFLQWHSSVGLFQVFPVVLQCTLQVFAGWPSGITVITGSTGGIPVAFQCTLDQPDYTVIQTLKNHVPIYHTVYVYQHIHSPWISEKTSSLAGFRCECWTMISCCGRLLGYNMSRFPSTLDAKRKKKTAKKHRHIGVCRCHNSIDGSGQDCSISNALAIEMLQSCTEPSKYGSYFHTCASLHTHHFWRIAENVSPMCSEDNDNDIYLYIRPVIMWRPWGFRCGALFPISPKLCIAFCGKI